MRFQNSLKVLILTLVLSFSLSSYQIQLAEAGLTEADEAKLLFDSGKTDKALKILKRVWQRDKTYGAGVGYAYYLGVANKVPESIQIFETVIEQYPREKAADLELAILLKRENRLSDAEIVLKRLYLRRPKDIQAVKEYAGILLGQKKIDDALDLLNSFRPKKSDQFDYLGIYGAAQFEAQNYEKALEAYLQLVAIDPTIIDFHLSVGKCYRKLKAFDEAAIFYAKLKMLFPDNGDPWFENGALFLDIQEMDNAKDEFKEAKIIFQSQNRIDRANIAQELIDEVDWMKGKSMMQRGDFANACPAIYEIYIRNTSLRYGFDSAVCYREYKQLNVAKILFLELLHNHPTNSTLFIEYYETLKAQNNLVDAKQLLLDFVGEYGYSNSKIVSRLAGTYLGENENQLALDTLNDGSQYLEGEKPPLAFLLIAGTAYRNLGKLPQAEIMFKKAQQQEPELLDIHIELFDTKQKTGNTIEAEIVFTELYQEFGLTPRVLMKRASLYLSQKKWDMVLQDCNTVLNDDSIPEGSRSRGTAKALMQDAKIELAKLSFARGEATKTVQLFQEIYFANPDSRNAINLGFFASTIGESFRTDTIMKTALAKDPENKGIRQVWAEVLMSEHRAPEVIELSQLIVGKDHIYKPGLSILVVKSLMEMGQWTELGETLEAIKAQPLENALGVLQPITGELPENMLSIQAIYYTNIGEIDKAIATWSILVDKYPEVSAYPLEIANIYKGQKDNDKALAKLRELLEKFPDDPGIWKTYSGFLLGLGDNDGWQEAGKRAINLLDEKSEDDFWLEINRQVALGNAYFNVMDFEKAEATFQGILDTLPFHYTAQSTLGHLYTEMRDYYSAAEAFEKALKLQPNNPYAIMDVTKIHMKINDPAASKYWESESIPKVIGFNTMVQNLKSSSLGVFAYRPVPYIGTLGSFTKLSVRPSAMTLVRETAFSDQPVAGFQIDQSVIKQSVGFFGPSTPAFWVDYTRVSSSGSIDVIANLYEFKVHENKVSEKGILQIYPSFVVLFENEKYVQTTARMFPMGKLKVNFRPTGSRLLIESNASYGVQRLDKYGLPTEFFLGAGSVAWGKGLDSLFQAVSVRKDKLPSGTNFSSIMTESAMQTSFGNVVPSMLVQTETLMGLPKLDNAFGYTVLGQVEYNIRNHVYPYATMIVSHSKQYEFNNVIQADMGIRYQNTVMGKTREVKQWYGYKIPFQFKLAYQQFWYPDSAVPESQTLFFAFSVI